MMYLLVETGIQLGPTAKEDFSLGFVSDQLVYSGK